jgi:WD40 repeat protein
MGIVKWSGLGALIPVVLLLLLGCNQEIASQTPSKANTSVVVTSTPMVEPSPSRMCNWPASQVSTIGVSNFYWADDGTSLIYRAKDGNENWYIYTLSTGETREHSVIPNATETPVNFRIEDYIDLFVAPDKKHFVYTQPSQGGYAVYAKSSDESESVLLGDIKGRINQNTWLDEGTRLILSIDWSSPLGAPEAYVYLVDILEKKVDIVIPHTSKYRDITYIGVNPDQSKLLFTSYSGNDRSLQLWDLTDNSTAATNIRTPLTLKWLPKDDEFMAAGYRDEGSLDTTVFVYNLDTGLIRYLVPSEIDTHPYIKDAIQISPNLMAVAFIDEANQRLHFIDCSHAIQ